MGKTAAVVRSNGPAEAEAAIRRFLSSAARPVLLEPGENQFPLKESSYLLEWRGSRFLIEVWDETRNLARRITGVCDERPGNLELSIERFGGAPGRIFLLDLSRSGRAEERRGARLVWREEFRRSLHRQFPDWRIAELSSETNLEESLSPAYPRALIRKGTAGRAAIFAPADAGAAAGAVTFGLIWLDYLRRRDRRLTIEGLALFVPQAEAQSAYLRLPFLNPRAASFDAFVYTAEGHEDRFDPADYGNLETELETPASLLLDEASPVAAAVERITRLAFVERVARNDGALSLRVRGIEFARATRAGLLYGLERKTLAREGNLPEVEALARELARLRHPGVRTAPTRSGGSSPKRGSNRRSGPASRAIDPSLFPEPAYGQVPALAGGDRGVIDLLAAGRDGRLAVLELKASEDIHLPLQALDYWIRVRWYAERGEFSRKGYFPGLALREDWPRLILIAPALSFHPKTETILRYFAPEIEVERIGLGVEWRQRLKVMFRLRGDRQPA